MYGFSEHVGELEMWVRAASEEEVFGESARALAEVLDDGSGGAAEAREIAVRGTDRPALLAEWLEELAFLAETEGFVPERVEEVVLGEDAVRARVAGHHGSPPHLVKAVTYHRLAFERGPDGWLARAVLDV
ncbi:MAG TPA: archease [Solirubrobacteraceae bacterium]